MRRLSSDEWSGLATLVVAIAVGGPVLFGAAQTTIPRGWWSALFVACIACLLYAVSEGRPRRRQLSFATSIVVSWVVVLTVPTMGLLPVLLVVTAAVSVYIVTLPVGFMIVGLNTAVLVLHSVMQEVLASEMVIIVAFYLMIQVATLLSSATLIREQRMRQELTEAHVDLRAASALLSESTRTAERLRISRELHDLIGHQLTVLTLELEAARHREGVQAREHVDRANRVARDLLADVRGTVSELRSEPTHLSDALNQVVHGLPGITVSVEVDPDLRLDEERTAAFVRAVQEIVTNTLRHAEARELWIEVFSGPSGAVLTAADDGRGCPEPVTGNGLRGLIERFEALGGDVAFDSNDGFRVAARVPIS